MRRFAKTLVALVLLAAMQLDAAETIRIAVGTQDTTINCATGGLIIREKKLLEKYLPKEGKYKDVTYDITWKTFTSGPPLTNEMIAKKLDIGQMADFPSILNLTSAHKAGSPHLYIATISGSVRGAGNGLVVPIDSPVKSLKDLKGKQISVPFGSAAHGMLLRAIKDLGWNPETDVTLVSQSPEIGGTSLKSNKIDGHANFVPFAELFPFRGFARKIFDGSTVGIPTSHGIQVRKEFSDKYPEIVVAYLKALIEADRLYSENPEECSELIQKVAGIEAEVNYQFLGPLGVQTRDYTLKPEFRKGVHIALDTLRILKRVEGDFELDKYIDDTFIRQATKELGLDYEARLKDYSALPLIGKDARTGESIDNPLLVAQIWVDGEPKVRAYRNATNAFAALSELEKDRKKIRVVFAQDRISGGKLFADKAWYVRESDGSLAAFLLEETATAWAKEKGGSVQTFAEAKIVAPVQAQASK